MTPCTCLSCNNVILIIRGAYLAAVAASLSNISVPIMFEKTAEWVASCQTYEGGFAAVPGRLDHMTCVDVIRDHMIQVQKHTVDTHFVGLLH